MITINILWLTKSSLVDTTAKEATKWGMLLIPINGTSPEKLAQMKLFASLPGNTLHVVTNYETVNNKECFEFLKTTPFKAIIIDEVHKLKGGANATPTLIWRNCKALCEHHKTNNGAYPVFLSGSILNNKPEELWSYLNIFNPDQFKNLRDFQKLFENQTLMEGLGLAPEKLLKMLAPSMIRRRKDEVARELPDKTILDPTMLQLDPKSDLYKIHRLLADDLLSEMDALPDDKTITTTSILAKLTYLRGILLAPGYLKWNYYPIDEYGERSQIPEVRHLNFDPPYTKLESLIEQIDDLVFEGERCVVFSTFNKPLEYLNEFYSSLGIRSAVLKGGSDYGELQRQFQQGELEVLLINSQSGSEGLNLHRSNEWKGGASQVVFADRWWNPERNRQGEDRCYRIGTLKPVFVRKTYVEGSVDLLIRDIEENKALVNAGITESTVFRAGTWKEKLHEYLS